MNKVDTLPEGLTGEILHGQLHTEPRRRGWHGLASTRLGAGLRGPHQHLADRWARHARTGLWDHLRNTEVRTA